MKEARFVSQNKEKWGKMENVNHLDTDTLASNYVILSDDLSYAKTFYPGSDVVKYLNQLISVYQINIYGQERSEKKGILSFWVREFPLLLYRERRTLLFAFLFLLFAALIGIFSTAKDDTFVRLILGDAYVDKTLENIENRDTYGDLFVLERGGYVFYDYREQY